MINKLALGTVQFGLDYGISNKKGQINSQEAYQILKFAFEQGIKTLDTARAYGNSEEVIGNSLQNSDLIFDIVTKVSAQGDVEVQCENSLQVLKCEKLYGIMFHDTSAALSAPSEIEKLIKIKESGKVQKIGFSLYDTLQLEQLFEQNIAFDLVQIPFNILDQRFGGYFDELKKRGVEIHARSVFLQGIFFLNPIELDSKFDEIKPKLTELRNLIHQLRLPYAAIPLCFGLLESSIDKIVIGIESLNNLKENIESMNYLEDIKKIISELRNLESNDSKMILPTNWR